MDYTSDTIIDITGIENFAANAELSHLKSNIFNSSLNTNKSHPASEISDQEPTIQDILLNDSRITPTGNGNSMSKPYCTQPTSGQKWWAAVLLGFLFALISSPAAYHITSTLTKNTVGFSLTDNKNFHPVNRQNLPGLLIHTIIFIIIMRIILW